MCLAIPGKVEQITTDGDIRMGRVNFGGVVKNVCLDYVPEVAVGDYTIVHVGFALSKIDEQSALETLELFRQMGALDENWPARKRPLLARRSLLSRPALTEAAILRATTATPRPGRANEISL